SLSPSLSLLAHSTIENEQDTFPTPHESRSGAISLVFPADLEQMEDTVVSRVSSRIGRGLRTRMGVYKETEE
ncbi:hypothetical protein PENTCL1PPCAC_5990, partial [Pristionchus entomophagus]